MSTPVLERARRGLRFAVTLPLRAYRRFLSPFTPATCRFRPSCSQYAIEAVEVHGVLRGSWLALRRVLRCHPFTTPGPDPVPPPRGAPTPEPTDDRP